jgi:hypothetical protein
MRRKGENPQSNHVVKQRPAPSQRHKGACAKRMTPVESFTSRPSHCWGCFAASERYLSGRRLPAGGSSGLRLSSLGALEAVTYRV